MLFDGDNEAAVVLTIDPIRNLINEYDTWFNVTQRTKERKITDYRIGNRLFWT